MVLSLKFQQFLRFLRDCFCYTRSTSTPFLLLISFSIIQMELNFDPRLLCRLPPLATSSGGNGAFGIYAPGAQSQGPRRLSKSQRLCLIWHHWSACTRRIPSTGRVRAPAVLLGSSIHKTLAMGASLTPTARRCWESTCLKLPERVKKIEVSE